MLVYSVLGAITSSRIALASIKQSVDNKQNASAGLRRHSELEASSNGVITRLGQVG
jgi:hypothetical protein